MGSAGFGEFQSVADQVARDSPKSSGIIPQQRRDIRGYGHVQRQALLMCAHARETHNPGQHLPHIECLVVELCANRIKASHIENIVDHAQQTVGGIAENGGMMPLFGCQVAVEQQFRHIQN